MLVASFDVGIINLALVVAHVDVTRNRVEQVVHVELIDTTCMGHTRVAADTCSLGHTKTVTDRLMHVVQERPELLRCDVVLIERQPIQGHTDVQEILFLLFRDRAVLVSPNAMHKHFNIQSAPYAWRKVYTVQIATPFLAQCPPFTVAERQHDMADALCILLYWLHAEHIKHTKHTRVPARPPPEKQGGVMVVVEDSDASERAATVTAFANSMRKYAYQKKSTVNSGTLETGSSAQC
jgi:hypothetical protein